jgi:hypothetical protein
VEAPARAAPLTAASDEEAADHRKMMSWPRGIAGWTATFAVLWLLCALAFNAGAVWLPQAVLLLAAGFENAVQSLAGVGPRLASKHGKFGGIYVHFGRRHRGETPVARYRRLGGFVGMLIAFPLLALGVIGLWEAWSPGYAPPPAPATTPDIADTLLALFDLRMPALQPPPILLDVSAAEPLFHQPWLILFGAALLVLAGAWSLSAAGVPARRMWSKAGLATACCLLPLACYHGLAARLAHAPEPGLAPSLEGPRRERIEETMAALPGELADEHYAASVRAYVRRGEHVEGMPSDAPLVLAFAAPASPLDRWHLTLAGPVRARPALLFTAEPVPASFKDFAAGVAKTWRLRVTPGRSADADLQSEWEDWLRKLVARVEG